jgi:hypothetical protein
VSDAGVVPRNAHGNYELWDGDARLLPAGAEWLRLPKVKGAAARVRYLPIPLNSRSN